MTRKKRQAEPKGSGGSWDTDPVMEALPAGTQEEALGTVPGVVERARERWAASPPRNPGHDVRLPPLRVTVYKAICVVLERSPTPLHEKEIARLVAETYPPLAEHIKHFNRQVHTTLIKRRGNGVCERVAPATWRLNGGNSQAAAPPRPLLRDSRGP